MLYNFDIIRRRQMRQNFHQNPSNSKCWLKFWRIWHGRQNRKISKRWKNRVWWSLMKFVLEQTFHQNNCALDCACQNDFYCFDAFGCIFNFISSKSRILIKISSKHKHSILMKKFDTFAPALIVFFSLAGFDTDSLWRTKFLANSANYT